MSAAHGAAPSRWNGIERRDRCPGREPTGILPGVVAVAL